MLLALSLTLLSATEISIQSQTAIASFYHNKFQGRKTADGSNFDQNKFTAASNQFPLGTHLKVTHQNKSVEVKVSDRISKKYSSRIDLSKAAFKELAHTDQGLIEVEIQKL